MHDLVDGVAKQIDIVTDDDEAPRVGAQMIAQPQDRIVVEMIGGLVQQKRVRFLEQDAGELDSTSLASRERTDLLVQHPVGKAECRRDPSGFTGGGVATGHGELMIQTRISIQGLGHGIALCIGDPLLGLADACEQGVDAPGGQNPVPSGFSEVTDFGVLGQVADRAVAGDVPRVLNGLKAVTLIRVRNCLAGALGHRGSGQELGHRCFSGPIATDQSDAHALAHLEGCFRDELSSANAHGEVLDVDHARHRTGAPGDLLPDDNRKRSAIGHIPNRLGSTQLSHVCPTSPRSSLQSPDALQHIPSTALRALVHCSRTV